MVYHKKLSQTTSLGGAGAALGNVTILALLKSFGLAQGLGAGANTNITVTSSGNTSISPGDFILYAYSLDVANSTDITYTDITNRVTITGLNTVSVSVTTATEHIFIHFVDLT